MGQASFRNLPPGEHSTLPVDPPGRRRSPVEYHLTEYLLPLNCLGFYHFPSLGNVGNFHLGKIVHIPYSTIDNGIASKEFVFQAICTRSTSDTAVTGSSLYQKVAFMKMDNGTTAANAFLEWDITKLWADLQLEVQKGGRLRCFHHSSARKMGLRTSSKTAQFPLYVVFERYPSFTTPQYVYHTIKPLVEYKRVRQQQSGREIYLTNFDWTRQFQMFMGAGWKLMHIFFDSEFLWKYKRPTFSQNAIWFFEKEASKLEDRTPIWEGTVVKYFHGVVDKRYENHHSRSDYTPYYQPRNCWNNLIEAMGRLGWELASVVTTPQKASSTVDRKFVLLFFFQRKIQETGPDQEKANSAYPQLPSGYTVVMGPSSYVASPSSGASGGTPGTSGTAGTDQSGLPSYEEVVAKTPYYQKQ